MRVQQGMVQCHDIVPLQTSSHGLVPHSKDTATCAEHVQKTGQGILYKWLKILYGPLTLKCNITYYYNLTLKLKLPPLITWTVRVITNEKKQTNWKDSPLFVSMGCLLYTYNLKRFKSEDV